MKTFQYISIRMLSGIGSDGRSIDSVGNGATDGTTHNSSVQQNTNNEHSGHNNTGDHNSLAQSGGASTHEGNISLRLFQNIMIWWFILQILALTQYLSKSLHL